ncbi:MAG: GGDEF domain-containing protein [Tissierellia bacterium]|nr:GGDEF domain-containing protein [Tissierellia bacterium]
MISQYIDDIKKIVKPSEKINNQIVQVNINRVFYLAIISVPIRLLIIIFLTQSSAVGGGEAIWRVRLLIIHTIHLVLFLILGGMALKLRKKVGYNWLKLGTQYAMILTMLFVGLAVTLVDQLVTYCITPFLIACVAIGAIFIIRPLYSLLIFSSGYMAYSIGIGIMQTEPSILLSNRVNGLTITGLGIFLSVVLWSHNVRNLQQREYIRHQQNMLQDKNKKLLDLATHDSLTKLINRRHFEERIAEEISRIVRYDDEACLLILDIDNFKAANDQFGHPIGDVLLANFAAFLKSQLRESDIISRIGGEEFAILLLNTNCEEGENIAQKIRYSIEKYDFIIEDHKIKITVSIGMTLLNKTRNSYEVAYRYADRALYNAKAKGKNKVEVWT